VHVAVCGGDIRERERQKDFAKEREWHLRSKLRGKENER